MSKNRLFRSFLYIIYLVFLLEALSRAVFLVPQFADRLWTDEDHSWRRAWSYRHQRSSVQIYHTFDQYDPSKGWATKPNIRNMAVFDNKSLNTDPDGFRVTRESPSGRKIKERILVLGDSFTFGEEVSDQETYPYYLQRMFPDLDIINAGVHGYGHDQMLILLREIGIKFKPDIVILGYVPWDAKRNVLSFRDFAKPSFVPDKDGLILTNTPVPRPEDILRWEWARPRLIDIYAIFKHRIKVASGRYDREVELVTTALLSEMIRTIEALHAVPLFVYLPSPERFHDQAAITPAEAYLFNICQAHQNARCISTRPYFAAKIAKGVLFREEGHYDPAGNLTVAEAIGDHLVNDPALRTIRRGPD